MSDETKENIAMGIMGILLTVLFIALMAALVYSAIHPPHACVKHNGEWIKSVIQYEKTGRYNGATQTTDFHKTGRIIYTFNGNKIVSSADYFLIEEDDQRSCTQILGK